MIWSAAGAGCSAAKFAGKTTVAAVSVTTTVAATAVRGTGKIALAAGSVSVDAAETGIKMAAKFSKRGAVVFFDQHAGVLGELSWKKDLTLMAAAQMSGLSPAVQAMRLIRAGRAIETGHHLDKVLLAPGDVVEIISLIKNTPSRRAGFSALRSTTV